MGDHAAALAAFLNHPASLGWRELPFFTGRAAADCALWLDEAAATGSQILPPAPMVYAALAMTPLSSVKVVILGQDPYPTPGNAHGLAFSYRGTGRLPASLSRILRERDADIGVAGASDGDLTPWAKQGVLLLNTALTVEAGRAGSHLALGWRALAEQVVSAASRARPAAAFILWGDKARAFRPLIDPRHGLIESAHPSPLAARGDFMGSRPFGRANGYLASHGMAPIDWR